MPPIPVAIFSSEFRSRAQRELGGRPAHDFFRTQVKRIFGAKQKRGAIEFGRVSELDRIFVEVIPTFLDQEDEH